jgi:hypothetical protein
MGVCMKTTVEISDALMTKAKRTAAREGTTVRRLIEEGLRLVLANRRPGRFRLRNAAFQGDGVHPDVAAKGWPHVRDEIYDGRGA